MKKRKIIKWIFMVLAFIAISNTPYVRLLYWIFLEGAVGFKSEDPSIHYSSNNPDGFSLQGGGGIEYVKGYFNTYRLTHPKDSVLYRNYRVPLWKFWNWHHYLTSPQYKLPYAPPPPDADSVERGNPFENGSRLIYKPAPDGSNDSIPFMVPFEPHH